MIEFYIQADECLKRNPVTKVESTFLAVREYYYYECPSDIVRKGKKIISHSVVDRVNDSIKAQFPKEYKKFSDYLKDNEMRLYEAARAQPGKPIKMELAPKVLEPTPQEEGKDGNSKKKTKKTK